MLNTRVVVTRYGGPEVLAVVEEPLRSPGAREVCVRVESAGVALADVMRREGVYLGSPTPPFTPGYDVVGVVEDDEGLDRPTVWVGHEAGDAAADADVVYTDTWASMGQEDSAEERRAIFQPYQVNKDLMDLAKSEALFLHCLPARRGEEVTADVLDGAQSIAGAASQNILFVQQAILTLLLQS